MQKKLLTKFNTHLWNEFYENSLESGHKRNLPQHNKGHIWQNHSKYSQWRKTEGISSKSQTGQGCPLSPLLFNIFLEVLVKAIRQEKEITDIQIRKEDVKLSLFADDRILYIEYTKEATKKPLELINKFNKVSGYKTNIQKSVAFLYTNIKLSEREIKKTIPFKLHQK